MNKGLENFNDKLRNKETGNVFNDFAPILTSSGDFAKTTGIETIIRSLIVIFTTPKGTYIFDPEFGIGLHKYIFEPLTEATKTQISNEINKVLALYESRAKIDYTITPIRNRKGFYINFTVKYKGQSKKISIPITESLLRTLPPDPVDNY